MKKAVKVLLCLCFAAAILAGCGSSPSGRRASSPYSFVVLSTTDMHGRATALDVASQSPYSNSMLKVASAVREARREFGDNVILIDNGDTIQGNLTAQYAINYRADEVNPMIEALRYIGYDVWGMGNHEFNFLPEQRDAQVKYALESGINVLAANIVLKSDGTNIHGESAKAGEPFYDPYVVKTIQFADGKSVKVAVIGFANAANYTWDLETNYPNLQFSSLENTDELLENEINKWVAIVKENENPDIIVVAAHSGAGTDDGVTADFLLEAQAITGIRNSAGVDLLVYGHDHTENVASVANAEGKAVDIVNGGGDSLTRSVFTFEFDDAGNIVSYNVESSLIPLASYSDDRGLRRIEQPWYEDTYAWASSPLGTFSGGWNAYRGQAEGKTNEEMLFSQTELLDLIHKAQIWASWQSHESEGIEGATVSIGSAVFATTDNRTLAFVPSDGDTISTLELSLLYRYSNNLLCAIEMTGNELYAWMSRVADMYRAENGALSLDEGVSIYGVDSFYGVDYVFDVRRDKGDRIVSATINGVDIRNINSIRVALNSYRLSGGYGFLEATGLTEADCFWTASTYLGSDLAPVPTQIGEYVEYMGTVSPSDPVSHGYDSSWEILY